MKRNWNWAVWTGASLVFLGVISYPLFFRSLSGASRFSVSEPADDRARVGAARLGACARIPALGENDALSDPL